MEMKKTQHSVYSLNYHLILVSKYRAQVFTEDISEYAQKMFTRIGQPYGVTITEWNHDKDHIHVLFTAEPKTNISKFINAYKSASSRMIKKEYPEVTQRLWKEQFWSRSFFLASVGGTPLEVFTQYVQSQGDNS